METKPKGTVNYLQFVDCTFDAVKEMKNYRTVHHSSKKKVHGAIE